MRLHLLTTPDTAVRVRAALVGRPAEYLSFTPLRSTRPHWQRDPDVLVIELEACSPHAILSRLAEELPRYPHVGLVLAGRLTPALARLVTHLAQTTALSVTLHGSDTLADVWRAIRHACLLVLHERVLHALAPALVMVEYGVVQAIRRTFTDRRTPIVCMPGLASAAGLSERSLYRRLARAGFAHPKDLIRVGRFLRELPVLFQRARPLTEVYRVFGYSDYGDFQWHTKRLLGANPRAVRHSADPATFTANIVRALLATPRAEMIHPPRAGKGLLGVRRVLELAGD